MQKIEITEQMIEEGEVELSVFAMTADDDGFTLCPVDKEPDHFDVELRFYADDGEIVVIEEFENQSFEQAEKRVSDLEAAYPGIAATWEYA
jgi:hypothetical protein